MVQVILRPECFRLGLLSNSLCQFLSGLLFCARQHGIEFVHEAGFGRAGLGRRGIGGLGYSCRFGWGLRGGLGRSRAYRGGGIDSWHVRGCRPTHRDETAMNGAQICLLGSTNVWRDQGMGRLPTGAGNCMSGCATGSSILPPRSPKARDRGHPQLDNARYEARATRHPQLDNARYEARATRHPQLGNARYEARATRRPQLGNARYEARALRQSNPRHCHLRTTRQPLGTCKNAQYSNRYPRYNHGKNPS